VTGPAPDDVPVTYTLPVPVDEQRPLPEFQMVACAEHLLAGHRWRCRACRTEVERQFRECCEELWRLQRATTPSPPADAQPSHPAPDGKDQALKSMAIELAVERRRADCAMAALVAACRDGWADGDAAAAQYLAESNPAAPPLSGEGRDERAGWEQVGWLGTEWDAAGWLDEDDEPAEGYVVIVSEEGRWQVPVGEWSLRHEDDGGALVEPLPLYVRAAALAAYTTPRPASGRDST